MIVANGETLKDCPFHESIGGYCRLISVECPCIDRQRGTLPETCPLLSGEVIVKAER